MVKNQLKTPRLKFRYTERYKIFPPSPETMARFAIHNKLDNVGVAIEDIKAGEDAVGVYIEDRSQGPVIKALEDIPLGHKIALRDIKAGESVIKYGRVIGIATRDIKMGQHVHTHNLKSIRWGDLAKRGGSR